MLIQRGLDLDKVPTQTLEKAVTDASLFALTDETIAKIEDARPSSLTLVNLTKRKAALISYFNTETSFDFIIALVHVYYRPGSAGFFAAISEDIN